jgi:hypothetical protein
VSAGAFSLTGTESGDGVKKYEIRKSAIGNASQLFIKHTLSVDNTDRILNSPGVYQIETTIKSSNNILGTQTHTFKVSSRDQ